MESQLLEIYEAHICKINELQSSINCMKQEIGTKSTTLSSAFGNHVAGLNEKKEQLKKKLATMKQLEDSQQNKLELELCLEREMSVVRQEISVNHKKIEACRSAQQCLTYGQQISNLHRQLNTSNQQLETCTGQQDQVAHNLQQTEVEIKELEAVSMPCDETGNMVEGVELMRKITWNSEEQQRLDATRSDIVCELKSEPLNDLSLEALAQKNMKRIEEKTEQKLAILESRSIEVKLAIEKFLTETLQ